MTKGAKSCEFKKRTWKTKVVKQNCRASSRRKANGPQDMVIDYAGTVQSSLSSKVCQTKAVVTDIDLEHKKRVETLEGKREISAWNHMLLRHHLCMYLTI